MLCDIRVTTQYRENYGTETEPYWKMKGGVEFIIPKVDENVILYADKGEVDRAIQKMLDRKSNPMCSYELLSWELIWSEAVVLSVDDLYYNLGIGTVVE